MPNSHDHKRRDGNDKFTALLIAAATGVVALIDQIIVPNVQIDPLVYGLMVGTALEAYPGIIRRLSNKK